VRLDYFIYDLATGELLQRLTCSAGVDRKANVALQPGRGAILTGDIEGLPDVSMKVDLVTKRLIAKGEQ
jgi:hypothetical protein